VIITGYGNGSTKQVSVYVNGLDASSKEDKEAGVQQGFIGGIQQVDASVSGHGPVVVFARTVYASERLFVQQAGQAMTRGNFLKLEHHKQVVIVGKVRVFENGCHFVLSRGNFIVSGLARNTQLPQFFFNILNVGQNSFRKRGEVVIRLLLSLGGLGTKERTAGHVQIRSGIVICSVNDEELLFGTKSGRDLLYVSVSHEVQDLNGSSAKCVHTAKKRCFHVKSLSSPRDIHGGDKQSVAILGFNYEWRGRRIPGSVTAGLVGATKTSSRETGSIGFTTLQGLTGEFISEISVGAKEVNE